MMKRNHIHFHGKESGQTLILSVIALLILLLATLFLFDLHSIIRVKIKTQTAADAAALTAANWQVHSLNLIGELNLVKACTVLVSDIVPFGDDSEEGITESSDILTEMQARISFVGPMIGFGAAQQAAKNNGMVVNAHYTSIVNQHFENLFNDDYYGEDAGVPQIIQNYSWRAPYIAMVDSANSGQQGIAAAPNAEFSGLPSVDPPWLMDLNLYYAIKARYWCYGTLRFLIKNYDFSGKWWQASIVSESSNFPQECEYSPVYIDYTAAGDTDTFDMASESINTIAGERGLTVSDKFDKDNPLDTDGINSPLPFVKWCIYETRWANDLPSSEWTDAEYLRSDLKPEYIYGGAVAKMTCRSEPKVVSSNYSGSGKDIKGNWLNSAGDPSISDVECSALAKPLGKLGDGIPPYAAIMVLPVFDKARLIPVAMQDPTGLYDPFDIEQYELLQFLKWAADVEDIDNPGPGCPSAYYLTCLQSLNDEEWRSLGYNKNYVETLPTQAYSPSTNPTGAGWLQMGHTYSYDETGNPTAILSINEDTCNYWPSGGGGPRTGPSVLH